MLSILFLTAIFLPGAMEGVKFVVIPKWEDLLLPKVWGDAAGQVLYCLTVGFGALMTYASYNKYHNDIFR